MNPGREPDLKRALRPVPTYERAVREVSRMLSEAGIRRRRADITGSIEVLNAAPNRMRMLIKADLTALGAGPIKFDQRFDGSSGYVIDTLQGNREITGNQLDNLRTNSFPHPFLNYKELGTAAQLIGKEKVGDRDAFVVTFDPTSGSLIRQYVDAETYRRSR
jgi:hypothetical protein